MKLILVLLGMYFDALVVFVTNQTLLFRLALAILCYLLFSFGTFDSFLAGLVWAEIQCAVHVALPKQV